MKFTQCSYTCTVDGWLFDDIGVGIFVTDCQNVIKHRDSCGYKLGESFLVIKHRDGVRSFSRISLTPRSCLDEAAIWIDSIHRAALESATVDIVDWFIAQRDRSWGLVP